MVFIEVIAGLFLFFFFGSSAALLWNKLKYKEKEGRLPPGTMGWPVLGETTKFLKEGPNFMRKQRARYGDFFKSHIFGCPHIISMDADLNRYILLNEKEGLIPGYPQSMLDVLGKDNIAAVHGPIHKKMRGALNVLINPNMMREQIVPKMNEFMDWFVSNWSGQIIDIQEKTKEMAFLLALKMLISVDKGPISESFMPQFYKLVAGSLSIPINLPNTNYHGGLKARKAITSLLRKIMEERRASPDHLHDDMLSKLIILNSDGGTRAQLNDEQIIDLIVTFIFSGFETVSTTSMMAIKYLSENPKALQQLTREHMEIRKNKAPGESIDWNDVKSMTFSRAVILESMRLSTIINGVFRKTTRDVKLNGYIIPKGWKIYIHTREINYDSSQYFDPLVFNPWRWLESNMESHKHFMLFGAGSRLCPGKESGMAEISIFLHHLVTRYRWEQVEGEPLQTFPRIRAPNGLLIKVRGNY